MDTDDLQNALMGAVLSGDYKQVRRLMASGGSLADLRTIAALQCACHDGNLPLTRTLVELGLGIDDFMKHRAQALVSACSSGNLDLVRYLHAECHITASHFATDCGPMKSACDNGHVEILTYLHTEVGLDVKECKDHCMVLAAQCGHFKVVQYLHQKMGLTRIDFMRNNCRPLLVAATMGHFKIVRYLLETVKCDPRSMDPCFDLRPATLGDPTFKAKLRSWEPQIRDFIIAKARSIRSKRDASQHRV